MKEKTKQQALETYITLLQEGICSRGEWWTGDKELRCFNINNEQNVLIKWTTACVEEVTIPDSARYMFLYPKKVKKGGSRTIEICPNGTWRFKLRSEK